MIEIATKNGEDVRKMKEPISTQLLQEKNKNEELSKEISLLKETIIKLEKEVKSKEDNANTHYKNSKNLEQEIEQIHQFLDAVPNCVERESKGEHSWETIKRAPMTRLAAWLGNMASK